MAMKQEANTPLILTIGAISAILVLVIMFGTEAWFRYEERAEVDAQWEDSVKTNTWRSDMRAEQEKHIATMPDAISTILKSGGKSPTTQPAAGSAQAE